MRRLFIAMIAGGFLLLSGVAASAKPDSANTGQDQNGQQQTQTQNDQKSKATEPAKPATTPAAKPATKPATTAPKPAATTTECGEQGDNTGDHQHEDAAACNDQNEQAGATESTNANNTAEKDGNNED
jgi:hypothetical protein